MPLERDEAMPTANDEILSCLGRAARLIEDAYNMMESGSVRARALASEACATAITAAAVLCFEESVSSLKKAGKWGKR
jgi:hypothetical protein